MIKKTKQKTKQNKKTKYMAQNDTVEHYTRNRLTPLP